MNNCWHDLMGAGDIWSGNYTVLTYSKVCSSQIHITQVLAENRDGELRRPACWLVNCNHQQNNSHWSTGVHKQSRQILFKKKKGFGSVQYFDYMGCTEQFWKKCIKSTHCKMNKERILKLERTIFLSTFPICSLGYAVSTLTRQHEGLISYTTLICLPLACGKRSVHVFYTKFWCILIMNDCVQMKKVTGSCGNDAKANIA